LDITAQKSRRPARGGIRDLVLLGCLALVCVAANSGAQTEPQATLHHRSKEPVDSSVAPPTKLISQSTIPVAASGEYLFGSDPNDVIQVTLTGNELSGYISRHGEAQNDRGAPLTLFFSHTWLDGERLGFDTQEIHGISYSFEGTIVRGTVKTTRDAGYYLLQGTLVQSQAGTRQPNRVSMKLAPHTQQQVP
jgi:hypothetical protein